MERMEAVFPAMMGTVLKNVMICTLHFLLSVFVIKRHFEP